jgi:hypothetical protein
VTRPGKWGNPFKSGKLGKRWAVGMFRLLMKRRSTEIQRRLIKTGITEDAALFAYIGLQCGCGHYMQTHLADLRGKNLACWCKPGDPCHADVLLELANAGRPS